jgi:hypothetical protein
MPPISLLPTKVLMAVPLGANIFLIYYCAVLIRKQELVLQTFLIFWFLLWA